MTFGKALPRGSESGCLVTSEEVSWSKPIWVELCVHEVQNVGLECNKNWTFKKIPPHINILTKPTCHWNQNYLHLCPLEFCSLIFDICNLKYSRFPPWIQTLVISSISWHFLSPHCCITTTAPMKSGTVLWFLTHWSSSTARKIKETLDYYSLIQSLFNWQGHWQEANKRKVSQTIPFLEVVLLLPLSAPAITFICTKSEMDSQ